MMRLKGFTLAEVLITLGIIGVVAAMTIPNLINRNQKRIIETNLKETYSILSQMMKMAENDDILIDTAIPDSMAGMKLWFETYMKPYVKYGNVCYYTKGCWHSKNPTKMLNGGTTRANITGIGVGSESITVSLLNGANLSIDGDLASVIKSDFGVETDGKSSIVVYIDANGNNGPNIIGKDIYIAIFVNGQLVPAGKDVSSDAVNTNCSKGNTGKYCLSKVKNSGWEIPNDVWNIKI
ncbi:MAG: type II secretion system GspH family protein [Muribaculaceae bacterium]|nr:type II secretion system GspH family protein [Muribaculaceae bacterium]